MKLWIIYKNGISFSKIIAEMLQDQLEDYIDVDAGKVKRIDPTFLLDEKFNYLIVGDILNKEVPSLEVQNWLLKYWEISKNKKTTLKAISGFYVKLADIKVEHSWVEFIHDNMKAERIYPPILRLKPNNTGLGLKNGTFELVKEYSNNFIDFSI
ncbi:MAG: hypothetical protein ACFFBF_12245 [Promethearchaeota archaeon]